MMVKRYLQRKRPQNSTINSIKTRKIASMGPYEDPRYHTTLIAIIIPTNSTTSISSTVIDC